jgi:hypothetical protein
VITSTKLKISFQEHIYYWTFNVYHKSQPPHICSSQATSYVSFIWGYSKGEENLHIIGNLMNGVEENNRESQKPTIALPSHVANSLVSLTRVWSSFKEVKNT